MRFLRARYRAIFRGDVAPARLRAYHDAFVNRTTFDATPSHRSATANTPFTLDRLATETKTAATAAACGSTPPLDITTRNIPKKAHLSNHTYTAKASQLMRLCHGFKVEPNLLDVHSKPMSTVPFLPVAEVVAAAKAGRMPTDDDVYLSRYSLKDAMDKLAAQLNDKRKR